MIAFDQLCIFIRTIRFFDPRTASRTPLADFSSRYRALDSVDIAQIQIRFSFKLNVADFAETRVASDLDEEKNY